MRAAFALAAVLALAPLGTDAAPDPAERLRLAEDALRTAEGPRARLAALGVASAAQEAALGALRADLRVIALRRAELAEALAANDGLAFAALEALDRLSRAPPAAFLAHPGGPVAAARAAALLGEAAPALQRSAEGGRAALAALRALAEEREALTGALRTALAALQSTRAEIAEALANGEGRNLPLDLEAQVASDAKALGAAARTLAEALSALPPQAPDAAAEGRFDEARGALPLPAEGRLARRFGETAANGRLTGIEIAAPAWALVRAPWLSTLRYAGEVGELGLVAILEPAPDTLIVLSGLAAVDRVAGEVILPGEPIGALGGPPPQAEEFLVEASQGRESPPDEILYIEMRRQGEPTDPEPWFAFPTQGTDG